MAIPVVEIITKRVSKSEKAGLQFPVGRIRRYLKRGRYADTIQQGAALYMTAVLEYLTAELLELSGNAARDCKRHRITPRHLKLAIRNDDELDIFIGDVIFREGGVPPFIHKELLPTKAKEAKLAAARAKAKARRVNLSTSEDSTSRSARSASGIARKSVGGKTVPGGGGRSNAPDGAVANVHGESDFLASA